MELIEKLSEFSSRFERWKSNDDLAGYSFVENTGSPFTPMRRALPLTNLALITAAGAYIDGTEAFEITSAGGDSSYREIPIEVEAEDLKYAARGFDSKYVLKDRNVQIPIERLLEYQENGVIGKLNNVWWSINGFIPDAATVAETLAPKIAERVNRYETQAALLIPSGRLSHQTMAIIARAIEQTGIPTMMLAVKRDIPDMVRPPRCAFYSGEYGCVVGAPNATHYQRRVLDESLRWIETLDQPVVKKLTVDLETLTENERGEA
jgi:D-proline reductase (dithiol) PrdB